MGETHVNLFGGSPLNRLSWLRPSPAFLNAVAASPKTRWVLFNAGQPLVSSQPNAQTKPELAFLSTHDVRPFLGPGALFGQGKEPGQSLTKDEETHFTEAARHRGVPIVFLGLLEPPSQSNALPSSEFTDPEAAVANLEGTPYFSVDVAEVDVVFDDVLKETELAKGGRVLTWSEPRSLMMGLDKFAGGVFAEARSMVDWNQRNKFCPACGSPMYSMWGGWKLACSSLLPWADNTGRKPCPTSKGLHNFTHPRTDPVVIMIAVDETGDRILLGRNKKFPGKFYSALAGFIEPGESFEDAVSREMWEEAGVKVWNIKYHSGQPWPYPANLMVGFYARADASKPIRIDLDNELADARWYTRSEVLAVLRHPSGGRPITASEFKRVAELEGSHNRDAGPSAMPVEKPDEPAFRVPPVTAIAGVLIRDWAEGMISFPPEEAGIVQKGNL